MDTLIQFQAIVVSGLIVFISLYLLWLVKTKNNKSQGRKAPEPAGAWPVIGHLHLLGGRQLLHRTLGAMADTYGPAFMIRLGMRRALVVSSWDVAKECFTTKDKILASRPSLVAIKHMGYNNAVLGFAPYGPYWREVRKIATLELLTNHRLEMLKHIRTSEIETSMKELYELWLKNGGRHPVLVEMKQWFRDLTLNVVVRMVAGKRHFGSSAACEDDESRQFQKIMEDFVNLLGVFVVSDTLPFLGWLDVQGYESAMKRTGKEMDRLLTNWVEEHRLKRVSGGSTDKGERDFIDVMLSILTDDQLCGYDADTVVKSTCLALIAAGSDTTVTTLTWALSLLLNNRHVLKKAQDELDIHVGKDRNVEESDIKNLVYIQAIVKETMRLYPAAPLSLPHESMEDCIIAGFEIPAGTRLLTNIWKLHQDPGVWPDPSKFMPERFLTSHVDVDVRGQHFEFIPFGSGRRMCPGVSFALNVLHIILARLLHGFELGTPSDAPMDMTESGGIELCTATPRNVLLAPRLPSTLYGY